MCVRGGAAKPFINGGFNIAPEEKIVITSFFGVDN